MQRKQPREDLRLLIPCFKHVYVGQDNPAVLIFVKHRKQRGGKRPMSAIVKYTTTNPVSTESIDEKSFLTASNTSYSVQKNTKTQDKVI